MSMKRSRFSRRRADGAFDDYFAAGLHHGEEEGDDEGVGVGGDGFFPGSREAPPEAVKLSGFAAGFEGGGDFEGVAIEAVWFEADFWIGHGGDSI